MHDSRDRGELIEGEDIHLLAGAVLANIVGRIEGVFEGEDRKHLGAAIADVILHHGRGDSQALRLFLLRGQRLIRCAQRPDRLAFGLSGLGHRHNSHERGCEQDQSQHDGDPGPVSLVFHHTHLFTFHLPENAPAAASSTELYGNAETVSWGNTEGASVMQV